jgi:hypothetical protein
MKIYPLNILKKIKWKRDNLIKKLSLITSKLTVEERIERKN